MKHAIHQRQSLGVEDGPEGRPDVGPRSPLGQRPAEVPYHRVLLRGLPARIGRGLDVGCGGGELASLLTARADHVDVLDRDDGTIRVARTRAPQDVTLIRADLLDHQLKRGAYDAIVSMSAPHHRDLQSALAVLGAALRPGGVLALVALPRTDLPRELLIELAGSAWHHLLTWAKPS